MAIGDDVEQFAALLRRLKDRTDRSYGSLARRLHMNTSTLHRYCVGEAVPQEYASVERLAAFCGATPEERLELHRLWLLAVTARQQPRTGEGALRPTEADRTPDPDAPASDALAPDAPDPDASAPDAPDPDASAPDRAPHPGTAPHPAVRPWYRRRRTTVGAAAATVLLVTLGSLSALSGLPGLSADRSHDDSARTSGRTGTTADGTSRHPSASATGTSSGRPSASPSTGARASAGPEAKGGPVTGTKGGAHVPAGVPLAWTADSQVWRDGCGHDYVIGSEPAQVPPPPVQQDAAAWAATQGAVHGRQTTVRISVQGKSSTAVVLEALRVRVVSRGTPVTGTVYAMDQGCGSDMTPRQFSVNLDVNRPTAQARPGSDRGKALPAVRFPYRVSAEDPEVLLVTATTDAYDCDWYLELDWSSQGRAGTVRVDDHGRPFRTSGIKGLPHYWYGTNSQGARQWVPLT
ncbi:helix-turn-helix domain-containing protein [Streptomyces sp. NPDC008313]|uniref:helix-turn-helix domain-containing protein n=1 Tax=Streptomyces sp. NPDC008313 TaxID=3364826 RepID=UPI0036E34B46